LATKENKLPPIISSTNFPPPPPGERLDSSNTDNSMNGSQRQLLQQNINHLLHPYHNRQKTPVVNPFNFNFENISEDEEDNKAK
jgi:hypothetical protein